MALQVQRWRKFGHDRIYANDDAGNAVGWMDVASGERRLLLPAYAQEFEAAMATAAAGLSPPAAALEWVEVRPPHAAPTYAHNRPGQAVLQQAEARRKDAPVRTFLANLLNLHTEERAWRIGGKGEAIVGRRLDGMLPEWRAVHSIPVGARGRDIDHLAVGPGGVFTINTKHHPGASVWVGGDTFLLKGQRVPYIPKSRGEALQAADLLSRRLGLRVQVRGIVALVGAEAVKIKEAPRDGKVVVLEEQELTRWLRRQPACLSPTAVAAIHRAACEPATWA